MHKLYAQLIQFSTENFLFWNFENCVDIRKFKVII